MFKNLFIEEVLRFSKDNIVVETLWSEIHKHYSLNNRYYHNLIHLDNLTTELLEVRQDISDWTSLVFSIAYHDIIYDPTKPDNEEKSAEFAKVRLKHLGLADIQKQRCSSQIIATKTHCHHAGEDTNFFTDADISILGKDPQTYRAYALNIRREYGMYTDVEYRSGRKKVLEQFFERDSIYHTTHFKNKYETSARNNLKNELELLGS